MQAAAPRVVRFGTFEVDLQTSVLRKSGREVRIQEQPRQVLLALLERPGEVITREELRQRLWPDGTFVDFEHGLNTAVKKLRDALGDAAENPRFVETVPLRGYRLLVPVEHPGGDGDPPRASAARRRPFWIGATVAGALVLAAGATLWWVSAPPAVPRIVGSTQLTYTGRVRAPDSNREFFPGLFTDGARIYITEYDGPPSQISATGGDVLPIPLPFRDVQLLHLSPDGSQFLVRQRRDVLGQEGPIWVMPAVGGAARRMGNLFGHDAAWAPDGRSIAYAQGEELYVASASGGPSRRLCATPGRAVWPRWSPDGARLRFTAVHGQTNTRSLWEVSAAGGEPRPLLPREAEGGDECCGEWTPDGRHYVYRASRDDRTDLWVLPEGGLFRIRVQRPLRLTTGPIHFTAVTPSRESRRLFVVGSQPRGEVLRYDLRSHEFTPYRGGGWGFFAFSRDGEWVAYVENRGTEFNLWRSRVSGADRLQLTTPPLRPSVVQWSPDGKRITFMGKRPGEPWRIYLVGAGGGAPQTVLDSGRNQADPTWSPDGRSLMFGHPPDYMAEPTLPKAIRVVDLRTREVSTLPGSEGLFSPRLYRVRLADSTIERILDLADINHQVLVCKFFSLAMDGSPLGSCNLSISDIYAVDWER